MRADCAANVSKNDGAMEGGRARVLRLGRVAPVLTSLYSIFRRISLGFISQICVGHSLIELGLVKESLEAVRSCEQITTCLAD